MCYGSPPDVVARWSRRRHAVDDPWTRLGTSGGQLVGNRIEQTFGLSRLGSGGLGWEWGRRRGVGASAGSGRLGESGPGSGSAAAPRGAPAWHGERPRRGAPAWHGERPRRGVAPQQGVHGRGEATADCSRMDLAQRGRAALHQIGRFRPTTMPFSAIRRSDQPHVVSERPFRALLEPNRRTGQSPGAGIVRFDRKRVGPAAALVQAPRRARSAMRPRPFQAPGRARSGTRPRPFGAASRRARAQPA